MAPGSSEPSQTRPRYFAFRIDRPAGVKVRGRRSGWEPGAAAADRRGVSGEIRLGKHPRGHAALPCPGQPFSRTRSPEGNRHGTRAVASLLIFNLGAVSAPEPGELSPLVCAAAVRITTAPTQTDLRPVDSDQAAQALDRQTGGAELEFVQIIIIVVVMMVMVVVITCLLSHYKLSARSFISRHSQGRRRDDGLSSEGCLWPSESTVSGSGIPEPTYPYLQHEIDLPPTISLSDGEEPPPYQGPCTLQLRDPEQQLELNRESVRAPPNRTIFDSDLMDSAMLGGPCPPSSNSGISAACYGSGGRMEGPPPTYSEVIGHYPGSFQHQQSSGPPSLLEGTRLPHPHIAPLESKEKEKQKGHPL
ncbi:Transmembrane prostate androgen-induced protein [Fukomys damarensis]|uniref:Transmembrane prostate androgen-induced protein n=1 Tax=Fukomys damarensis TaxID=885580 RepID=A0A091DJS5_FUKDA|nr:Transmembrane prostate androgen-induced protein [Fukomys damarensis]